MAELDCLQFEECDLTEYQNILNAKQRTVFEGISKCFTLLESHELAWKVNNIIFNWLVLIGEIAPYQHFWGKRPSFGNMKNSVTFNKIAFLDLWAGILSLYATAILHNIIMLTIRQHRHTFTFSTQYAERLIYGRPTIILMLQSMWAEHGAIESLNVTKHA